MPINYASLKTELQTDPMTLGYAPHVTTGEDAALASLLNTKSYRGPVPLDSISSYCTIQGITGTVKAFLEVPIGSGDSPPTMLTMHSKGVLHQTLSLIEVDFRLSKADTDDPKFGSTCDSLVSLGVMGSGNKADLIALGNNQRSRAEVLFGDGTFVSHSDVSYALRNSR